MKQTKPGLAGADGLNKLGTGKKLVLEESKSNAKVNGFYDDNDLMEILGL